MGGSRGGKSPDNSLKKRIERLKVCHAALNLKHLPSVFPVVMCEHNRRISHCEGVLTC